MKKDIFLIAFIAIAAALFFSFSSTEASTAIELGPQTRELRSVDPFTGISVGIPAVVHFTQGSPHKVEIDTDADVLQNIETTTSGSVLQIKFKQQRCQGGQIDVYITAPELNRAEIAGSADFLAAGGVSGNTLKLSLSGSGKYDFADLKVDELTLEMAGSGNALIKGTGRTAEISLAGSGHIDLIDFSTRTVSVSLAGSSDCQVCATETLKGSIAGSGKIRYRGQPVIDVEMAGSGKLLHVD